MNHSVLSLRPPIKSLYEIGGSRFCIEAWDEWSAQVFDRIFAGWHLTPIYTGETVRPLFTIKVYTDMPPPSVPISLEGFETMPGGLCYTDGQTYFLASNNSAILVHPQLASCVEVWIADSAEDRSPEALARIVFHATGAVLRRCGLFELHSGGVVEPETGAGVLLIGQSGSGKSTLTIRLAGDGWRYLSDDTILLSENEGAVIARGLRRFFAATEATIGDGALAARERLATTAAPFKPHKRRFEPEQLFPQGFVEYSLPRALFFTSITYERRSRCEELARHEVMTRLLKMYPWACFDKLSARQYLRVCARLVQQSVTFDLFAGRDVLDDPTCASRILTPCVKRSLA